MPATIVGSANGRSMSALTRPLPRKRSRTSTHATSVPASALIAATASAARIVSRSDATACALVTASQKAAAPPSVERATTAASGMRTMTLSHSVATPSARAPEPPQAAPRAPARMRPRPPPRAGRAVRASLGSGDPRFLLDLGQRPGVRVEELVVDAVPAAEVADREQALRRREARRRALGGLGVHRPVAPAGEALLGGRRQDVVQERLRL